MSDNQEFSQLVMPYSRKLFAVAYHFLQRGDEAEDVVQDIFVKLWQMRDKLPPNDQLEPFMLVMTKNLCIDRLRSRQLTLEYDDNHDDEDSGSPDEAFEDDRLEHKDRLRIVLKLIKELPPDQAKVLKLKVFDELENEQIARLLNIKEDNVRQLLSRGRKRLKELAIKNQVI